MKRYESHYLIFLSLAVLEHRSPRGQFPVQEQFLGQGTSFLLSSATRLSADIQHDDIIARSHGHGTITGRPLVTGPVESVNL